MQEPSNSEILRAVEAIDAKFAPIVSDHETRIKGTEKYISDQIAVADYVAKNGTPAQKDAIIVSPPKNDEKPNNLVKTILIMFSLFSGIIGLITYIIQMAFAK